MSKLSEQIQTGDWKAEKHVPILECPTTVKADEVFKITACIGKEIGHPNTTEHHIRFINIFFLPEGSKFTYQVGSFEFNAHGESVPGPNEGPVYTHHEITASMKVTKAGTLTAVAYCNIHGLWQSEPVEITVS